jgi:hypothetical protein
MVVARSKGGDYMDQMEREWEAWQIVVQEWPGDINDPKFNRLVAALRQWAEELSELRREQGVAVADQAKAEAHAVYERMQDEAERLV